MAKILKHLPETIEEEEVVGEKKPNKVTFVEMKKEEYDIVPCPDVMEDICKNTKQFSLLSQDICKKMFIRICYKSNPTGRVRGTLEAPKCQDAIDRICGTGGLYLKKTAELTDAYLIWYHHPKHAFVVWADSEAVCKDSMNRIRARILKYSSNDSN